MCRKMGNRIEQDFVLRLFPVEDFSDKGAEPLKKDMRAMQRNGLIALTVLFAVCFGWACSACAEEDAFGERKAMSFDEAAAKQAYPSLGTGVIPQTPEELVLA